MNRGFKLQGIVSGAIRTDNEMRLIDKELAEKAFKTQKKRLESFLKEKGFVKYKTNSYIRKNEIDVLEYFDLQMTTMFFSFSFLTISSLLHIHQMVDAY